MGGDGKRLNGGCLAGCPHGLPRGHFGRAWLGPAASGVLRDGGGGFAKTPASTGTNRRHGDLNRLSQQVSFLPGLCAKAAPAPQPERLFRRPLSPLPSHLSRGLCRKSPVSYLLHRAFQRGDGKRLARGPSRQVTRPQWSRPRQIALRVRSWLEWAAHGPVTWRVSGCAELRERALKPGQEALDPAGGRILPKAALGLMGRTLPVCSPEGAQHDADCSGGGAGRCDAPAGISFHHAALKVFVPNEWDQLGYVW